MCRQMIQHLLGKLLSPHLWSVSIGILGLLSGIVGTQGVLEVFIRVELSMTSSRASCAKKVHK